MRLDVPMAENIIAALAHLEVGGTVIKMMGDEIALLPDDHRLIAERLIPYWQTYKEPPGVHTIDLFADIADKPDHDRQKQLLVHILSGAKQIAADLNPDYVLSRLATYMRFAAISAGVMEVATHLSRNSETEVTVSEAEEMLNRLLHARKVQFDPGLSLNDSPAFLTSLEHRQGIPLRILPLDNIGVVPQRGTLFVLVGVTGRGKTWFLVHCGVRALAEKLKVAHISLEIDGPSVLGRYYQTMWQCSEHAARTTVTELTTDDAGRITNLQALEIDPSFAFREDDRSVNPELERELAAHLKRMGGRSNNLRIKSWPPHRVNVDTIEAYLDMLDEEHWHADVLLVDYPKLFKFKRTDTMRLELGHAVEDLRRIAQERHMAVIMVHQANRKGAEAKRVGLTHISEDWSIVQTADYVLSYSATEAEEKFGLARLHIDKARGPRNKGQTMILTQNYDIGQFARTATLMPENYLQYLTDGQRETVETVDMEEGLFHEKAAAAQRR